MKKIIFTIALLAYLIFGDSVLAQRSSESGEQIREKVAEKVEAALNKPISYMGAITDKTDNTLQIKNSKGEIQQVSIDPDNSTFVQASNSKDIDYEEVAIGDFIVAMGVVNGNQVLHSSRILLTTAVAEPVRKVYFGTVASIEGKNLELETAEETVTLVFPKTWEGPEIKDINEGDKVAIVAIPNNGKLEIRTIEILSAPTTDSDE